MPMRPDYSSIFQSAKSHSKQTTQRAQSLSAQRAPRISDPRTYCEGLRRAGFRFDRPPTCGLTRLQRLDHCGVSGCGGAARLGLRSPPAFLLDDWSVFVVPSDCGFPGSSWKDYQHRFVPLARWEGSWCWEGGMPLTPAVGGVRGRRGGSPASKSPQKMTL